MHSPRARPINLPGCRTVSTTVVVGNELELQCIHDISTATSSLLQKTFPMSITYESNLPSCCSFPCSPRDFTRALSNMPQEITQSDENLQPAPMPIFQWVVHTSGFLLLFRIKLTCWFGSRTQGKRSCKTCRESAYIYTLGSPARQKKSQFHLFPKQFVEQALRIPAPHSGKGAIFTDLPEPTLIILPQ